MRARRTASWCLVPALVGAAMAMAASPAAAGAPASVQPFGRPAPAFEQNVGQFDPQVLFRAKAEGYGVSLGGRESVLTLGRDARARVRMTFAGADPSGVRGEVERKGRVFYVSDPDRPTAGAARFDRVRYAGAWPGTDVVFHGTDGRQVRFDFELAPGADPDRIRLAFDGADRLTVEPDGGLALAVGGESLRVQRPVVFQETRGGRRGVEGRFVAEGPRAVRFALAEYDRSLPLVIDPTIDFTSYLGTGADEEVLWTEARGGSVYVSGRTWNSAAFPAVPANSATLDPDPPHCFVSKFTPDGSDLAWSVVFNWSGTLAHECGPFALGPNATVHAAFRAALSGGQWGVSVFSEPDSAAGYAASNFAVPELQPDQPVRIQADNDGNTYLLGSCNPATHQDGDVVLPNGERTVAYLTDCTSSSLYGNPRRFESLLLKIAPNGLQRLYGTFVGGTPPGTGDLDRLPDTARALAVDPETQVAWVGGSARSNDLAGNPERAIIDSSLHPPLHTSCGEASPGACMPNAFVLRYDTTLAGAASLTYASYYGIRFGGDGLTPIPWDGTLADWFSVEDMALDPGGAINLFGNIRRVRQANQPYDLFVVRLDPWSPSDVFDPLWVQLAFEKVIAGSLFDTAVRIARRPNGDLVLGGLTASPDFPQVAPLSFAPSTASLTPFVSVLRPSTGTFLFSSALPGEPPTWPAEPADPPREGVSVAAPNDDVVYAAWTTTVDGLASTAAAAGPFQGALAGASDGVVARLCFNVSGCPTGLANNPPTFTSVSTPVSGPLVVPTGGFVSLAVTVEDLDADPLSVTWELPSGPQVDTAVSGDMLYASDLFPPGTSTVRVTVDDGRGGTATATIEVEVFDNTPTGTGVRVWPGNETNPQGGGAVVTVTGDVQAPGNTFLSVRNDVSPLPPSDRQLGSPPYYYDVRTTATFATPPTVCIDIRGHGFAHSGVALYRHAGGAWAALPSTVVETTPGFPQICAPVTLGTTPTTLAILTPEVPATRIRSLAGTTPWDPVNDRCLGVPPDPNDGVPGAATSSRLFQPEGAVYDAVRHALFFAEVCGFRVRRLDLATGTLHTVTGTGSPSQATGPYGLPTDPAAVSTDPHVATLREPRGVAIDRQGNLYVADGGNCRVRKVSLDATGNALRVDTVLGTGVCGYFGDGGPARDAQVGSYLWIRTDASGALYVSDHLNGRVRRVDAGVDGTIDGTETILTVAGGGSTQPGMAPASPTSLELRPLGLALAPSGDLYVALVGNNSILRLTPGVDRQANGSADEQAALVLPPYRSYGAIGDSLALLPSGDLLWGSSSSRGSPDWQAFGRVNRLMADGDGVVDGSPGESEDVVAGYYDWASLPLTTPPAPPRNSDGDGHALSARIQHPVTLVPLPDGSLVVLDSANGLVRLIGGAAGPPANQPPVADAGPSYAVVPGDRAILDGSASSDPEGNELTYRWTLVSRPPESSASLADATSVTALLVPDKPGEYRVELVVNDGSNDSAPAVVTITAIDNIPPDTSISGAPSGTTAATGAMLTLSASEPVQYYFCRLDGEDYACPTVTVVLQDLTDGLHTFSAQARDLAGNSDATPASVSWEVQAPPVVTITSPPDGAALRPTEVPSAPAYTCVDNSGAIAAREVTADGAPLAGPLPASAGMHVVRVLCVDSHGNEGAATATYTVSPVAYSLSLWSLPDEARVGDTVRLGANVTRDADRSTTVAVSLDLPNELDAQLQNGPCRASTTLGTDVVCTLPPSSFDTRGSATVYLDVRAAGLPSGDRALVSARVEGDSGCVDADPVQAGTQCATAVGGPRIVPVRYSLSLWPSPDEARVGDTVRLGANVTRDADRSTTVAVSLDLPDELDAQLQNGPCRASTTLGTDVVCTLPPSSFDTRGSATVYLDVRAAGLPSGDRALVSARVEGDSGCVDADPVQAGTQCATAVGGPRVTQLNVGRLDTPGGRVTLSSPAGTVLENLAPGLLPASPVAPRGVSFPYGLLGFTVRGLLAPGQTISVRIELPPTGPPVNQYWKLQNNAWMRMSTAVVAGNVVVLTLTDGGLGDSDGTANGVIVDPGAPGFTLPSAAQLVVSGRRNRSNAHPLDGAALRGPAYVFVAPSGEIARVRFWIDRPGLSGPPVRTDDTPEFDLVASTPSGNALPLVTQLLGDGWHLVSAEVTFLDGSVRVLHSAFQVRNRRVLRGSVRKMPVGSRRP